MRSYWVDETRIRVTEGRGEIVWIILILLAILVAVAIAIWITVSLVGLLVTLVVAGIVGFIADRIVPGNLPYGLLGAVVAGLVGSWIGTLILGDWWPTIAGVSLIPSLLGAILLAFLIEFFWVRSRGRRI
ncbi:MAG: GlsB/YeaQ/YmgE family stress response membrane protein [Thermomicrobiaceae bacterium]